MADFDVLSSPGIYTIKCLVTQKQYIGSAKNLYQRRSNHFTDLRRNCHDNPYLQNAFNKYGEQNFIFEVVEKISDVTQLVEREQFWIDQLKTTNENLGYNIRKIANSNIGFKHSEETKKLLSKKSKGRPAWNKGLTKETSEKVKRIGEKNKINSLGNSSHLGFKNNSKQKVNIRKGHETCSCPNHVFKRTGIVTPEYLRYKLQLSNAVTAWWAKRRKYN